MFKKGLLAVLILGLMVSVIACTPSIEEKEVEVNILEEKEVGSVYPLAITDGFNREVSLEKEPITIISVAPSITEIVYAVGAGDKLVGRTDYCNYPEEALEVESIGNLMQINIEKIAELNPDVVLASTHFSEESLTKLDELGIKVIMIISQESFECAYSDIKLVGEILNRQNEAKDVVNEMQEKVALVEEVVKDAEKKLTYYIIGFGEYGDYTATGDTFINSIISMAGGENAARDAVGWKYSLEKLIEKDPQVIICENDEPTMAGIIEANGYKDLTAIKNGELKGVDKDMASRIGPRLADSLLEFAKAIHPELFK